MTTLHLRDLLCIQRGPSNASLPCGCNAVLGVQSSSRVCHISLWFCRVDLTMQPASGAFMQPMSKAAAERLTASLPQCCLDTICVQ
jgi:hypothetical protein